MTESMTDEQFAVIRGKQLALVSTFFDGSLLVKDQDGGLWELSRAGTLLPHTPRARVRVTVE